MSLEQLPVAVRHCRAIIPNVDSVLPSSSITYAACINLQTMGVQHVKAIAKLSSSAVVLTD